MEIEKKISAQFAGKTAPSTSNVDDDCKRQEMESSHDNARLRPGLTVASVCGGWSEFFFCLDKAIGFSSRSIALTPMVLFDFILEKQLEPP